MFAFVAKKKLNARARSLGLPIFRASLSNSCRMVVSTVNTCASPGLIRLAISRVFSWVPVERNRTDPSLMGDPEFARLTAGLLSERRRAYRATIMFVIFPPAGSFQLPPRLSVCCAINGAHIKSRIEVRKNAGATRVVYSIIFHLLKALQVSAKHW